MSLGLYIHWPYCARLCPYCDFNVYRARGQNEDALLDAIIADLHAHAARLRAGGDGRPAETLFIGGGTPSLLSPRAVARLVAAARAAFALTDDAEISLEANPEDRAGFADLVAAGVNRLSLGVQGLRDAPLLALGRRHDADAARAAIGAAAATGARVSVDLIYARDGQTIADWGEELREVLQAPVEHLSLYQLTIADGTAFARAAGRGALHPPGPELAADFYEATQDICDVAGFPAYEISNHARDERARARHNLIYWRGGEWVGVGPGAHGRLAIDGARIATRAFDRPEAYIAAVSSRGVGWESDERLSPDAHSAETLFMGLRTDEGVARAPLGAALDAARIEALAADGFLVATPSRLTLTRAGRLLADRIGAELLGI
jgi:oxygen-independent coproporphyrinogen-3 oxidase